jgi:hypothetical protein
MFQRHDSLLFTIESFHGDKNGVRLNMSIKNMF